MQIDLVTNLPALLNSGFHSLLLCVDVSSHYIIGRPISDHLQTTIYNILLEIFTIILPPRYIGCDHQSSFIGIVQLCEELDIICVKSTPGSKNKTSSVNIGCRLVTEFLQKLTTSLDLSLQQKCPLYIRRLLENLNSSYFWSNLFFRTELFMYVFVLQIKYIPPLFCFCLYVDCMPHLFIFNMLCIFSL